MIVALIPVRGGSKGIPGKNIRSIYGKPLVHWTIEAAQNSHHIDQVFVATDSENIRNSLQKLHHTKLNVIGRSQHTATDEALTESVMLDFAEQHDFSYIALIQATSPLLTSSDINSAFEKYFDEGADSLLTCVEQKRFVWGEKKGTASPLNYDPLNRPRRQNFQNTFVENGALYITSKDLLVKNHCRISGRTIIYKMPSDTYFEIDEPSDWFIVEALLKNRSQERDK